MPKRKYAKKIAAIIMVAAAAMIAIATIQYVHPPEKLLDSRRVSPEQTYLAFDGNATPSGYVFHEIKYDIYINGAVVYSSGTLDTSWTCPDYIYGQEGNPKYKVDYALAWTDVNTPEHSP